MPTLVLTAAPSAMTFGALLVSSGTVGLPNTVCAIVSPKAIADLFHLLDPGDSQTGARRQKELLNVSSTFTPRFGKSQCSRWSCRRLRLLTLMVRGNQPCAVCRDVKSARQDERKSAGGVVLDQGAIQQPKAEHFNRMAGAAARPVSFAVVFLQQFAPIGTAI